MHLAGLKAYLSSSCVDAAEVMNQIDVCGAGVGLRVQTAVETATRGCGSIHVEGRITHHHLHHHYHHPHHCSHHYHHPSAALHLQSMLYESVLQ